MNREIKPGIYWRAENPAREAAIIRILYGGDKGFNEIREESKIGRKKWGKRTLSLYLDSLMEKGCIKQVKHEKRMIYSLNKDNDYVMQILGHVRVCGLIDLTKLNEEEFVTDWLNSIKFTFLNVLQDYMVIGEGVKELQRKEDRYTISIERIMEAHLSDMIETTRKYGQSLVQRIERKELEPNKIWGIRNRLLDDIRAGLKATKP